MYSVLHYVLEIIAQYVIKNHKHLFNLKILSLNKDIPVR